MTQALASSVAAMATVRRTRRDVAAASEGDGRVAARAAVRGMLLILREGGGVGEARAVFFHRAHAPRTRNGGAGGRASSPASCGAHTREGKKTWMGEMEVEVGPSARARDS